jgi:hypothetical protein
MNAQLQTKTLSDGHTEVPLRPIFSQKLIFCNSHDIGTITIGTKQESHQKIMNLFGIQFEKKSALKDSVLYKKKKTDSAWWLDRIRLKQDLNNVKL